jgi:hypothetical protein
MTLRGTHRRDHELPPVVTERGWRYHHLGVPTATARPDEVHLAAYGLHVSGFATSPFGIEWMRFDADSPLPEVVRTLPHLAFAVDDLDAELAGFEVLVPPGTPSAGVRAAMILADGAPIELIEFRPAPGDR